MKKIGAPNKLGLLLASAAALALCQAGARAGGAERITAVASRVSPDYARTRLPDGSFQPEEYGFGEGGRLDGAARDASIDKTVFMDIVHVLVGPLAAHKYEPARSEESEKLLIVVFWGTTVAPDPLNRSIGYTSGNVAMMDLDAKQRAILDYRNAKILGYDTDQMIQSDFGNSFTNSGIPGLLHSELVSELEESRYFVVLMVYDFQAFRKGAKHKLWETRFSINEPGNHFDKALPAMAQYASAYFGQDSHGLLRRPVAEGRVDVGEPKALGEAEAPAK